MKAIFNRKFLLLFISLVFAYISKSQNTQVSIGTAGITEVFNDTKLDPNDGATINVGNIDLHTGNSNDILLIKLNASHQMVWQKTISNPGDDILYKVIVCANGDYVATGQYNIGSLKKGFVCRINSTNGNLIWSKVSTNASNEQIFWDVTETADNNIAVSGLDDYRSNMTNSFVVLLSSNGTVIWSKQSATSLADEIRTIIQLSNGNLLLIGFYNPLAFNYYATITEVDESTGTIINQNTYNINTVNPDGIYLINSLWSAKAFVRNASVLIDFLGFQGYGTPAQQCIFTYDTLTKNLSGNIYYHTGSGTITGLSIYPFTDNDFLVSNSTTSGQSFISRITNGSIVFDRIIDNNIKAVRSMDISGMNASFAGLINNADQDAYNFFTTDAIPLSTSPCSISDANTLTLIPHILPPTAANVVGLFNTSLPANISLTLQDLSYVIDNVCGFIMPVQLLGFDAVYKAANKSVSLNWSTSSELNSKSFVVERAKSETNDFISIGSVNAAGTTNTISRYNLTDKTPLPGINQYRLKQTDIDGKFNYSYIRTVNCNKQESDYTLSPVPANTFTMLKFTGAGTRAIRVDIVDETGRLVKQQNAVVDISNQLKIGLRGCYPGIYFLKISSTGNDTIIKKLVIQ